MDDPAKTIAAIGRLLSPFPPPNTAGSPDDVLRRYLEAVDDALACDVDQGVTMLLQGKMPGVHLAFAPTPPQLATATRWARDERLESARRARLPAPPPPPITHSPDSIERVRRLTSAFVEKHGRRAWWQQLEPLK